MTACPLSRLRGRFRGALLGLAIGDALGAAYEGTPRLYPEELQYLLHDPHRLTYTDDTAMAIGVAASLVECRGFDGAHMAATFVRNFEREPGRGYGAGPPEVFGLLTRGVAWDEAGRRQYGGTGSYGNGAAMRVAPVALFAHPDLDATCKLAREQAGITHAHPLGMEGAELQALAVGLALRAEEGQPIDRERFLDELRSRARSDEFRHAIDTIGALLPDADKDEAVSRLGHGIAAIEAVPAAIFSSLSRPDSFADAVIGAVSFGGDTDTIAAMTGAIAGARLGEHAIPAIWRDGVEGADELVGLADALFERTADG